jgi:hypothetical protein
MKKLMVLTGLVAALMILPLASFATTAARLNVTVPFAFYAENAEYPAGVYEFEFRGMSPNAASSSSVLLRKQDGTVVAWLPTMAGSAAARGTRTQLVFNQYGEKYFLSRVECLDYKASLRMTKAEKETRAQAEQAAGTILVAAK